MSELPTAEPLVPRGNPLRWTSGLIIVVAGLTVGFFNLLAPSSSRSGVWLTAAATALITFGLLRLLGTFDDPASADDGDDDDAIPIARVVPGVLLFGFGALSTFVTLRLAVAGLIGPLAAGLVLPVSFLASVAGAGMALGALGLLADQRPFYLHEGFWLIAFTTAVLLPTLGSYSLIDPWESHYGEVSREILARKDWISLWWAHEEWFWSKPILSLWMQSLSMATLGVEYESGGMLANVRQGLLPWPEWAVRFPFFLVTLGATYIAYKAIAGPFGRRAGLLAGVVLTTMPQWFFISHQTMTDMPFAAGLTAALCFFLLGANTPADRLVVVRRLELGSFTISLSARQLVLGAICAVIVPQILYLFTRNFAFNIDPAFGLRSPPIIFVEDKALFGSAGNCGQWPGNKPCHEYAAAHPSARPILQAVLWLHALGLLLWLEWGERRVRRLYFLAAFACCALATMAKGPGGVVLPAAAALGYVIVTRRYKLLLDLEIAAGAVAFSAMTLPWMVAMFVRHGSGFVDRLLFHDIYKRAFDHVHDTNTGDDVSFRYYVWQLGYGTFPWVGLLPAAALDWLRAPAARDGDEVATQRHGTFVLLVMWFVVTFALFAYMQTKFHHYVLPALPPLALLAGVTLDRFLGAHPPTNESFDWKHVACACAVGPALVLGALALRGGELPRWLWLAGCAAAGLATLAWLARRSARRSARESDDDDARSEQRALGTWALVGAPLVFLVGRDMAADRSEQPSDARLLHLFTYQYERGWPPWLDFSPTLWAFAFAGVVTLAALAARRLQRQATLALCALATAFALFCLSSYLPAAAPHWGQRQLVLTYLTASQTEPGPLVAYQMNWKGENFYAGNRLATFDQSGKPFRDWIAKKRREGHATVYFVLLHNRLGSLTSELGQTKGIEPLTTVGDNNKFVLCRAHL